MKEIIRCLISIVLLLTNSLTFVHAEIRDCSDYLSESVQSSDIHKVTPESAMQLGHVAVNGEYLLYLKFLISVDEGGSLQNIYFQNTNTYRFHADYIRSRFMPGATSHAIDQVTLRHDGRKFLLGTLLATLDGGYRVEFISEDPMTPTMAIDATLKVYDGLLDFSKRPELLVPRKDQDQFKEHLDAFAEAGIALHFQSLNSKDLEVYASGWNVGVLRTLTPQEYEEAFRQGDIRSDDLLLLQEAPREIPPVAGVILASPTTPSSHITLLAQMYGVPFVFDPAAEANFAPHIGKRIYFMARQDPQSQYAETQLFPIQDSDIELLLQLKKRPQLGAPPFDVSTKDLKPLSELTASEVKSYGAKSVGLGFLLRNVLAHTAEFGLGVPLHYYSEFLKLGINEVIQRNSEALASSDLRQVQTALAEIRQAILTTDIPEQLLMPIVDGIRAAIGDEPVKLKFRSSSNVEDLKSFNGAGLYDSKGAKWPDAASVKQALRAVWASTFNDRAYLARRSFSIDERAVGMGVLIQKSFKGELANGVAIVDSVDGQFRSRITGFPGEDLEVTAAPPGVVPETMTVTETAHGQWNLTLTRQSTEVPNGRYLLEPDEYLLMTQRMQEIFSSWPDDEKARLSLDLEWKVMPTSGGGRQIFFKQVRAVPDSIRTQVQDAIVLGGHVTPSYVAPEYDEALGLYHLPTALDIKWETARVKDLLGGKNPIESLVLKYKDGTEKLTVSEFKTQLTGDTPKQLHLQVQGTSERLGHIEFGISMYLNPDADDTVDIPVLMPLQAYMAMIYDGGRWPRPYNDYSREQFVSYMVLPSDYGKEFQYPEASWSAVSTDRTLKLDFDESDIIESEMQKTTYKLIRKVTLSDQDLGSIQVIPPGLFYAPAHHNFSFSYVVDLQYAEGDVQLIQAFVQKYGRFVTLGLKNRALKIYSYDNEFRKKVELDVTRLR